MMRSPPDAIFHSDRGQYSSEQFRTTLSTLHVRQARKAVFAYLTYYNRNRLHSTLKRLRRSCLGTQRGAQTGRGVA
jgi:transposase InsO family protein